MIRRIGTLLAAGSLAVGLGAVSSAAAGSAPPKTRSGKSAQIVASGVATPTGFAFGDGKVFMSDGTPPPEGPFGGVYILKHAVPLKLAGSPAFSFGVTWHKGTLFISAVDRILAWKGWNGTEFTKRRVIYRASKRFPGFNGLAFGHDGRLYVGVDVGQTNDHGPAKAPFQYDVLSMTASGKHLRIVARGIRQPWQFAFPRGSSSPFVSDLGQDKPRTVQAPDAVLRIRPGQNYGFPSCNWTKPRRCRHRARPFQKFSPHTDPMGLAIVGRRLFISEFGAGTPARVVSIPLGGGRPRVELSGFGPHRNVVGLGAHRGWVYVGETAASVKAAGTVYRFRTS
jgi:glucose/arabinose dehydrogenase